MPCRATTLSKQPTHELACGAEAHGRFRQLARAGYCMPARLATDSKVIRRTREPALLSLARESSGGHAIDPAEIRPDELVELLQVVPIEVALAAGYRQGCPHVVVPVGERDNLRPHGRWRRLRHAVDDDGA